MRRNLRAGAAAGLVLCAVRGLMTTSTLWSTESSGSSSTILSKHLNASASQHPQTELPSASPSPQQPLFAHAFLVAGCDPDKPAYRFFLYDVLVAARLLHEMGSRGDIIIFVQLSQHAIGHDTLPDEDLSWLQALDIKVRCTPKATEGGEDSHYRAQFDKFRILNLTEHPKGVLCMDADVMPVNNLDCIFESTIIKENMVIAGPVGPSNGGFFLLRPGPNELTQINQILETREKLGKDKGGFTRFDPVQGWGHDITQDPNDYWETRRHQRGTSWLFHAAFADQGLLHHWVKYAKKNVTLVIGGRIEQWGADANGAIRLEETLEASKVLNVSQPHCFGSCHLPIHRDHVHFGQQKKPWLKPPPTNLSASTRLESANHLWYWTLMQLNGELNLGLDFGNWTSEAPPLGMVPRKKQGSRTPIRLGLGEGKNASSV